MHFLIFLDDHIAKRYSPLPPHFAFGYIKVTEVGKVPFLIVQRMISGAEMPLSA
jgi:hypothetical protein